MNNAQCVTHYVCGFGSWKISQWNRCVERDLLKEAIKRESDRVTKKEIKIEQKETDRKRKTMKEGQDRENEDIKNGKRATNNKTYGRR